MGVSKLASQVLTSYPAVLVMKIRSLTNWKTPLGGGGKLAIRNI